MPANKIIRVGPVALTTTTTTNILNSTVTSLAGPVGVTLTQPYFIVRKIVVGNKTASEAKCALWIGATGANAAGTEYVFTGKATAGALDAGTGASVPANGSLERFPMTRMDSADFLVGGASAATTLTIELEVEVGFS